jgi:hypothetical protein
MLSTSFRLLQCPSTHGTRCRVGFFAFVPLAAFASTPFGTQKPFFQLFVNPPFQFRCL